MSTFAEQAGTVTNTVRAPARVVTLPPGAFKDDWYAKTDEPRAVGLRVPSARDLELARAGAVQRATNLLIDKEGRLIPDVDAFNDTHNDALMFFVCARCTTDPLDASKPFLEMAEDALPCALTVGGVTRLYDEILALSRETSPVGRELSESEGEELLELVPRACVDSSARVRQLRRLLAYVLDELRDVLDTDALSSYAPTSDETSEEAEWAQSLSNAQDDVARYSARGKAD